MPATNRRGQTIRRHASAEAANASTGTSPRRLPSYDWPVR